MHLVTTLLILLTLSVSPCLSTPLLVSNPNGRDDPPLDITESLTCVHLSAAAYCTPNNVQAWSCIPCRQANITGFRVLETFYAPQTDTNGYIGLDVRGKRIVIAFMGSRDILQWIYNFDVIQVPLPYPGVGPDVRVHAGFFDSYQDVKDVIDAMVNSTLAQDPSFSILITGHSLGAALSTICAIDLTIQHLNVPIRQYTFGEPRVGNLAFAQYYNSTGVGSKWRFTHNRDPVPHLPPELVNYHHAPTEVFYLEDYTGPGCLKICDNSGEDPKCSDQFSIDANVSDHLHYLGLELDTEACNSTAALYGVRGV